MDLYDILQQLEYGNINAEVAFDMIDRKTKDLLERDHQEQLALDEDADIKEAEVGKGKEYDFSNICEQDTEIAALDNRARDEGFPRAYD